LNSHELRRALDMDGRAHLLWSVAVLDGGVLGIAQWLVLGELRALCALLRVLAAETPPPILWTVKGASGHRPLRLLQDLMRGMEPETRRIVAFVQVRNRACGSPCNRFQPAFGESGRFAGDHALGSGKAPLELAAPYPIPTFRFRSKQPAQLLLPSASKTHGVPHRHARRISRDRARVNIIHLMLTTRNREWIRTS
jgi:hypothetical protein